MDSSIVIKVKYENTLRRFNARIINEDLDLNMDGLREKIVSLFKFAPDTQLTFTYNDEDNDVVALVDDEDLRDVVRQALNPLRITVTSNTAKSLNSSAHLTGSSTPSLAPPLQETIQNLKSNVSEIPKALPKQLREPLAQLSSDFAEKMSIYGALNLDEIFQYLNQLSGFPSSGESKKSNEAHKDADGSKNLVVPTEVTSGVISGRPTSKTKKVLQESKIKKVLTNDFLGSSRKQAASVAKETGETSYANFFGAPSVAVNGTSSEHSRNTFGDSGLHNLASGFQYTTFPPFGVTGETSAANFFSAQPVAVKGNTNDIFEPRFAEDFRLQNSAPGFQYTMFPPFPSTSLNDCPITEMPITNDTTIPHDSQSEVPEENCNFSPVIHKGIICDGCDVHPITGPRFKSKVRDDYDLCSVCFAEMGNETDFIRIDHPLLHHRHLSSRHPLSRKGSIGYHGRRHTWTVPGKFKRHGAESNPLLDSRFIIDVNIPDGTIMPSLTRFTKIWRMRNNGTAVWPQGTRLVWIGGVKIATSPSVEMEIPAAGIQVDQEVHVAVDFVAPQVGGRYISYWRMALPTGQKFGQRVWVLIEVDPYLKKYMHEARPGFNLNFPPASEGVTAPEFDVPKSLPVTDHSLAQSNTFNSSSDTGDVKIPEPVVDQSVPDPNLSKASVDTIESAGNVQVSKEPEATNLSKAPVGTINLSKAPVETIEPAGSVQVSEEQEAKFPIDDTLLVGGVKYAPGQLSSVSYPIIDDSKESDPTVSGPSGMAILASDEVNVKAQTEEKILKELEGMGFKQAALNKEILEMNNYNLEQTINDLCGDSEWDPILEELEEMGFYDRDINKRLLRKNDGSIKRVVMDLIAGEAEKF